MKKRSRRFGSASRTHWMLLVVGADVSVCSAGDGTVPAAVLDGVLLGLVGDGGDAGDGAET
jgi:hypothetical protein